MYFIWCLFMAATLVSAMENPAPQSALRKYACCPKDFGYSVGYLDGRNVTRRGGRLCDFEETEVCTDARFEINMNRRLFMRLMLELSQETNPAAQHSFEELRERLRVSKIRINGERIKLTPRDFFHRFLAHLPGYINRYEETHVQLNDQVVQFIFAPCIHKIAYFTYSYPSQHENDLFGDDLLQQFEHIRPLPSLISLCLPVVEAHRKNEALEILPQELKSLIEQ